MIPASSKISTAADAIRLIPDGAAVALGGHGDRRTPMALVREFVRQGRRDLHLVGWDAGVAFDLLMQAGCARSVEAGDEATRDRIRAAAFGWQSTPGPSSRPALRPDFVLLHAHWADGEGNVRFAVDHWEAEHPDLLLARSGATLIVSAEQIVSGQAIAARPADPLLPGATVSRVVEAPYGAFPSACDTIYDADEEELTAMKRAAADRDALSAWIDTRVSGPADLWDGLDRLGARRLLALTTNRLVRV